MKKLLMGSICLLIFSISILIFQISCKKVIVAQSSSTNNSLPPATTSALGAVIVGNGLSITDNGVLSANETSPRLNKIIFRQDNSPNLWVANFDGSGLTEITVTLPAPYTVSVPNNPIMSPDGTKLFIVGIDNTTGGNKAIFACNADGTNPVQIIDTHEHQNNVIMCDAY